MREEDKKAFCEEYLELCRKYKMGIEYVPGEGAWIVAITPKYESEIKGLME